MLTLVQVSPKVLHGAILADKAVGKAAAACMIVGGIQQVYADVMSEPALELLKAHDVTSEYGQLVDHIINRTRTGWCPMELLSRDETDPEVIIRKIQEFFDTK